MLRDANKTLVLLLLLGCSGICCNSIKKEPSFKPIERQQKPSDSHPPLAQKQPAQKEDKSNLSVQPHLSTSNSGLITARAVKLNAYGKMFVAQTQAGQKVPLLIGNTWSNPREKEQLEESVTFWSDKKLLGTMEGNFVTAIQMDSNHIIVIITKSTQCKHELHGFDNTKGCSVDVADMIHYLYRLELNSIENQQPVQVGIINNGCFIEKAVYLSKPDTESPEKLILQCTSNNPLLQAWNWDNTSQRFVRDTKFGSKAGELTPQWSKGTKLNGISADKDSLWISASKNGQGFVEQYLPPYQKPKKIFWVTAPRHIGIKVTSVYSREDGGEEPIFVGESWRIKSKKERLKDEKEKDELLYLNDLQHVTPALSRISNKSYTALLVSDNPEKNYYYSYSGIFSREVNSQIWMGVNSTFAIEDKFSILGGWLEAYCYDKRSGERCKNTNTQAIEHSDVDEIPMVYVDDFQATYHAGRTELWYLGRIEEGAYTGPQVILVRYRVPSIEELTSKE